MTQVAWVDFRLVKVNAVLPGRSPVELVWGEGSCPKAQFPPKSAAEWICLLLFPENASDLVKRC